MDTIDMAIYIVSFFTLFSSEERIYAFQVRNSLTADSHRIYTYDHMVSKGMKTIAAFDLLLEEDLDNAERAAIYIMINKMNVDKSKYKNGAIESLAKEYVDLRLNAIELLVSIKSKECLPHLTALMWDPDNQIVLSSSAALSKLGDVSTVTVFDIWLRKAPKRLEPYLGKPIQDCREGLKARLDKEKAERKKAGPPGK
jgi:hypothetical protein